MSRLQIYNITQTSFTWRIDSLSLPLTITNYLEIGVTSQYFSDGSTNITSIYDKFIPTETAVEYATGMLNNLPPSSSYKLYGYTKTLDGKYWNIVVGSPAEFTLSSIVGPGEPALAKRRTNATDDFAMAEFIYSLPIDITEITAQWGEYGSGVLHNLPEPEMVEKDEHGNGYFSLGYTGELKFGTRYNLRLKGYNKSGDISAWSRFATFTTAPKYTHLNYKIDEVPGEQGKRLRFNLPKTFYTENFTKCDYWIYKNGLLYNNGSILKSEGAQNNSREFRNLLYGNYELRASICLTANQTDIYCVTNTGEQKYFYYKFTVDNTVRPDLFQWTYPKSSGYYFNLTADEWISLCDNILDVLHYIGKSNISIGEPVYGLSADTTYKHMVLLSKNSAIKGDYFTAKSFNYVRYVIGSIKSGGTGLRDYNAGEEIKALYLNTIVEALNSIT